MGSRATRFALVFWMALAVAVIILALKPWAGARDSQSTPVLKVGRSSAETQAFPISA
jgi:hypothetical protein